MTGEMITTHLRIRMPEGRRPAIFDRFARSTPLTSDAIVMNDRSHAVGHQRESATRLMRAAETVRRNPDAVSIPLALLCLHGFWGRADRKPA